MKTILMISMVVLLITPLTGEAIDVLLLGDEYSETQVQPALEAAGYAVTFGGIYDEWDGVTPAVTDFDVVVFLNGYDYGYPLLPAAATALQSFVANGSGLIMTEWTAYDVCQGYKGTEVADLMPVTMPDCGVYYTGATWGANLPGHELLEGISAPWDDGAQWSMVTPKPGTTVVAIDLTYQNSMLSYSMAAGGTVVHINHDMTYTTATINPNALQLFVNAVKFAGQSVFSDGFESGNADFWSASVP